MSAPTAYQGEVQESRWILELTICALCLAFFLLPSKGYLVGNIFIFSMIFFRRLSRRRKGRISVSNGALRLDGELLREQRSIRRIVFGTKPNELLVTTTNWRDAIRSTRLVLRSQAEASDLARALQHDETGAALSFTLHVGKNSMRLAKDIGIAVAFFVGFAFVVAFARFGVRSPQAFVLAFNYVLATVVLLMWSRTRVRIGNDGVLLTGWFSQRFIAYEHVASFESVGNVMTLVLVSGQRVQFSEIGCLWLARPLTGLLLARLREAHDAAIKRAPMRVEVVERLKIGRRTFEEWKQSARSASQDRYRVAATTRESFVEMVEDGLLSADVRVGAALALVASGEPVEQLRVAITKATSAMPELNAALDAALQNDDARLEHELAKFPCADQRTV